MGVGALEFTEPLLYTSHSATNGPMALLQEKRRGYANTNQVQKVPLHEHTSSNQTTSPKTLKQQ
jgi:hypothetical protein